jgi:response regulator RpfG family c-di-GMP phosphodiesterase
MLTGNIDQGTAKDAVNEGKVFRFLTKPVAMAEIAGVIDEGLGQFRLRRAEKELLEKTLGGIVKVLADIMAAADPVAYSRASTIKWHASAIAEELGIGARWQIDLAAMLSQIGWVAVPAEVRAKVREDLPLTDAEAELVRQVPATARGFLHAIPRLEPIAEIVYLQSRGFDGSGFPDDGPAGNALPIGARILRVASDLAAWEAKGLATDTALARMGASARRYDPAVLAAAHCRATAEAAETETVALDLTLRQAAPGDVLINAIESRSGKLVLAAGQRLTEVTLARLHALDRLHPLQQPFTVRRVAIAGTQRPARPPAASGR